MDAQTLQMQRSAMLADLPEDDLISQINRCQNVVDKLSTDEVWLTVVADAQVWVQRLDSQWQDIYDDKQLAGLRVLKQAYTHISSLPEKYKADLKTAQDELERRRNPKDEIEKDYDNNTKFEG